MSRAVDQLRNSRLTGLIRQVEAGEPIDVDRHLLLTTLDLVQTGREFLADAIELQEAEDARAIALLTGGS